MSAIPRTRRGPNDRTHGTLGGLLYSKGTEHLPNEKDWVALVHSMAAGDQLALRELYGRIGSVVFTLIMRIVCNRATAEELTADVFHEAWRRARAYDPADGTVIGWLMNIARSRALDQVRFEQRKKRRDSRPEAPSTPARRNDAEEALVAAEHGLQLRNAIAALAPNERQAIETAYFQGLTHAETAARLGEPLGTVKTRIRSGLAKLRAALAPQVGEP